jgi:hypothetical protein
MPHWLLMQVAVPLVGTGQSLPHCPQLSGSVLASTQPAPHGMNPVAHWKEHWPALQLGAAFAGAWQTLPHEPQLEVSEPRLVHAPPQAVMVPQSVPHWPP